MNQVTKNSHNFTGVRIEIKSNLRFDEVFARLQAQTTASAVTQISEIAARSSSSAEFDAEVNQRFVGPSGFMTFAKIDHSPWIKLYGIRRRVTRMILGNPLIAITMIREDITAGLFAPVEILLVEDDPGCSLFYVLPSSLMVIDKNELLRKAAIELDRKLESLIATITGLEDDVRTVA